MAAAHVLAMVKPEVGRVAGQSRILAGAQRRMSGTLLLSRLVCQCCHQARWHGVRANVANASAPGHCVHNVPVPQRHTHLNMYPRVLEALQARGRYVLCERSALMTEVAGWLR